MESGSGCELDELSTPGPAMEQSRYREKHFYPEYLKIIGNQEPSFGGQGGRWN